MNVPLLLLHHTSTTLLASKLAYFILVKPLRTYMYTYITHTYMVNENISMTNKKRFHKSMLFSINTIGLILCNEIGLIDDKTIYQRVIEVVSN